MVLSLVDPHAPRHSKNSPRQIMAKRLRSRKRPPEAGRQIGTNFIFTLIVAIKRERWPLLRALLIVAAGFWVFWPALQGGWIGDDVWYIVDNPLMNDPARIWKAWFQLGS